MADTVTTPWDRHLPGLAPEPTWEPRPNPAPYNAGILAELARHIWLEAHNRRQSRRPLRVLDPFAGTGRIHWIANTPKIVTIANELEPEWAIQSTGPVAVGNATALPYPDGVIDLIATSPTYANRFADLYDGRDGSERHTYRIDLDRLPSPGSACGLQWGEEYRVLHEAAWREAFRVLRSGGLMLVNIKDHQRKGQWIPVTEWHHLALTETGFTMEPDWQPVAGPGLKHGANHDAREATEYLLVGRKP